MSFGALDYETARADAARERALALVPILAERASECERRRQLLPETMADINRATVGLSKSISDPGGSLSESSARFIVDLNETFLISG